MGSGGISAADVEGAVSQALLLAAALISTMSQRCLPRRSQNLIRNRSGKNRSTVRRMESEQIQKS